MQSESPPSRKRLLRVRLNGRWREDAVAEGQLLVDYLRDVGMTGVKTGCDGGECGACTVLVDGEAAPSCMTLAARCEGRSIETIEGLGRPGQLDRLQRAFHEKLGTQCGFCTPGMIMAAEGLLRRTPAPDRGRDPRRLVGQSLPLHRLREDHRSRSERRRRRRHDRRRKRRRPRRAADRRHREGDRARALHRRSRSCRCTGRRASCAAR